VILGQAIMVIVPQNNNYVQIKENVGLLSSQITEVVRFSVVSQYS
jgi:hypothetical protein